MPVLGWVLDQEQNEHSNILDKAIASLLRRLQSHKALFVGFSGGLDSTVLLHLLSLHKSEFRGSLHAIHVDHGLHKDSMEWARHCVNLAQSFEVSCTVIKVSVTSTNRKGVESVARTLRYQAFSDHISDTCNTACLLTGHHQRDQAETVLLNLGRGAGVNGLAAMPYCKVLSKSLHQANDIHNTSIEHCRPFINVPYTELKKYAVEHGIPYIDDPSNQDVDFKRNRVRHQVLPVLNRLWPDIEVKLAKTAHHLQEASLLLDEYAEEALSRTTWSTDFVTIPNDSKAKVKNLIRYWFKLNVPGTVLNSRHYDWILDAVSGFRSSHNQNHQYQLSNGELRVYKDRLYYLHTQPQTFSVDLLSVQDFEQFLRTSLSGTSEQTGNYQQALQFCVFAESDAVKMVLRSISDRDNIDRKRLKTFFQQHCVPPWQRKVWPVLEQSEGNVIALGFTSTHKIPEEAETFTFRIDYQQRLRLQSTH